MNQSLELTMAGSLYFVETDQHGEISRTRLGTADNAKTETIEKILKLNGLRLLSHEGWKRISVPHKGHRMTVRTLRQVN